LADWLHEREARRALRRLQPPDSVGPALERENQRILLTIPHPDDEVLGCHYFLETEASRQKIDLVYVTDGEGCATARLFDNIAAVRRAESAGATGKFAIAEPFHWALADGGLASARDILAERLERHVKERPCDVLLGPAPNDRTSDHAALGDVIAALGRARGIPVLYYRSTWATFEPGQASYRYVGQPESKQRAVRAFRSQRHIPLARALRFSAEEARSSGHPACYTEWLLRAGEGALRPAMQVRSMLARRQSVP
jgi:LmbE family N-acetylglucosaminyl deacetylase